MLSFHTAAVSCSFVMLIELVMLSLNNFTDFVVPFELVMCAPHDLLCVVN